LVIVSSLARQSEIRTIARATRSDRRFRQLNIELRLMRRHVCKGPPAPPEYGMRQSGWVDPVKSFTDDAALRRVIAQNTTFWKPLPVPARNRSSSLSIFGRGVPEQLSGR